MSDTYVCFSGDTWYRLIRRKRDGEEHDHAVYVLGPNPDLRPYETTIYAADEMDGINYSREEFAEEDVPNEVWAEIARRALVT